MKRKGTLAVLLGLLLILSALALICDNMIQSGRAQEASVRVLDLLTQEIPATEENTLEAPVFAPEADLPDYVRNPDMEMPVASIDGIDYIGVLTIPVLELELPVVSQWSYPKLQIAPCRYTGSAYLQNMTICAHNYTTHFGNLKNLHMGDEVRFTDMDGNVFTYLVADIETLPPTAVEEMTDSGWDLSLFTCTIGGSTRVTVRCERVEV